MPTESDLIASGKLKHRCSEAVRYACNTCGETFTDEQWIAEGVCPACAEGSPATPAYCSLCQREVSDANQGGEHTCHSISVWREEGKCVFDPGVNVEESAEVTSTYELPDSTPPPLPPVPESPASPAGTPLHLPQSEKSRLAALLLLLFLPWFSAHRFYTGRVKSALWQLFLFSNVIIFAFIFAVLEVAGVIPPTDEPPNIIIGVAGLSMFGGMVWVFVDFILILCGEFKDRNGCKLKRW